MLLLGSIGGCSSTEGDGHDVVMNNDARTATEVAVLFASPVEVAQALVAGGLPCGDYAPHEPGSDPALAQCITVNPTIDIEHEFRSMRCLVHRKLFPDSRNGSFMERAMESLKK